MWVARRFKPLIEENPVIDEKLLGREIHCIYGLVLPAYILYRAKNKVLNVTKEDHKRSYNNLYAYGFIVRQKNSGSLALIKTLTPHLGAPSSFQRFFLSFQYQKAGFMFVCTPFIELDGYHMNEKFHGVILSAVAMDANNGAFPVAISISESECNEFWGWFCVRYLTSNMQRQYKGQLSGLYLWNTSDKSTKGEFMEEITKLQEVNNDAYNYIMKVPLKHWALHAFENYVKSDHVSNNISECFNVWMEKVRAQPAMSIFKGIRRKMMQRMAKRLEEGRNRASNIPHLVNKKLSEKQDDLRFVSVLCASDKEFGVKDDVTFYIVNLDSNICDYGLWELYDIPCKHALAVLTGTR
ncbi:hypothetical protein Ddye_000577 [Dipteronia dyeriana]|uniref:SWIM-type domain-containing protein n=1 Tax=Dipteronia dyeriana TaxID=168575 RepID=A0AAD9XNB0_9ROSI|nr:hypothetical protein Ddye_000577 [Dipteronia dyeriana]